MAGIATAKRCSRSPATTATAPFTPGHPATAASTSPSSTLWPRIFTCCWESLRPRNSKTAPGQVAAHVPRPVPAPPVLDEGGGRLPRIAQIPVGQAPPADPQLAGHPVGAVEAVLAHDAEGLVGEGSAVGDRAPRRIDLPDLEVVRPYAGLGRAAHGHEQHPLGQLRAQTQRHPVAGDEGQPQTGRGPGPSSSITSSRAGAEFHTVTPRDETSSRHADASRRSSSSGSTTAAPNEKAPKMSNTERSKSRADTPRTASPGPMPHRRTTSAMVFHAAAWLTATPFGTPVEPDV